MTDFTKPPPRGAFDYLLEGIKDEEPSPPRHDPPPLPPVVRLGGGPQHIHIIVELPPPRPRPRRKPQVRLWSLLFWLALLLLLFGVSCV